VLTPNLEATKPIEERLSRLPEVSQVRTLNFFVPPDQDKKLAAIKAARDNIEPSFKPEAAQTPPTDEENVAALNEAVTNLKEAAEKHKGGQAARRRNACPICWPSSHPRRPRCARKSRPHSCAR
jgi:hypothetical protein